jgi:hypothetical protein
MSLSTTEKHVKDIRPNTRCKFSTCTPSALVGQFKVIV